MAAVSFVSGHQHGRHDVTWKPSTREKESFLVKAGSGVQPWTIFLQVYADRTGDLIFF